MDDNYLRDAILDPGAHVAAGWQPIMPTFRGQLDEESIANLISYLKSLPDEQAAEAPIAGDEPAAAETKVR